MIWPRGRLQHEYTQKKKFQVVEKRRSGTRRSDGWEGRTRPLITLPPTGAAAGGWWKKQKQHAIFSCNPKCIDGILLSLAGWKFTIWIG